MKALSHGPVANADVARIMQRDEVTAARLVTGLDGERLIVEDQSVLSLPT